MSNEAKPTPSRWQPAKVADSFTPVKGVTYTSSDYGSQDTDNVFLTIKCVTKGGGFNPEGVKYFRGVFLREQQVSAGDLLVAMTDLTRDGDIIGSPMLTPDFGH